MALDRRRRRVREACRGTAVTGPRLALRLELAVVASKHGVFTPSADVADMIAVATAGAWCCRRRPSARPPPIPAGPIPPGQGPARTPMVIDLACDQERPIPDVRIAAALYRYSLGKAR